MDKLISSIKVSLFRDFIGEGFISMEVYADNLKDAIMRNLNNRVGINEICPNPNNLFLTNRKLFSKNIWTFYKYVIYPRGKKPKSDINHIIDQSYGHLVHFLDARKTIVTCHDLMPLKIEEGIVKKHSLFRPGLLLAKYSYSGLKKTAKILADSESTKKDLIDLLKIKEEKIVVVPLAVSPFFCKLNDSEKEKAYHKFNLHPKDSYYIFHVGGVGSYKNIPGILKTLRILIDDYSLNIKLLRAGTPFTNELTKLSDELKVSNSIVYLGRLSDDDLRLAYNIADVFFFPSVYEGFGLPILEAMACGTPVVISNAPSLVEIANDSALKRDSHDHRGFANAINQLITNRSLREEMVKRGLKRKDNFTWEKTVQSIFKVYEEVYMNKQYLNNKSEA